MQERIHDDEPDTSEATVRALLAAECPAWQTARMTYLRSSGTDNAMWRLRPGDGDELVVRLPRRPGAAANVQQETDLLQALSATDVGAVVQTPTVRHIGEPHEVFPHRWTVLGWLPGTDAWVARHRVRRLDILATELAEAVLAISNLAGMPGDERAPGRRGGPIGPLLRTLESWLEDPQWDADNLIDVAAIRRLAAEASEIADEPVSTVFAHGDLIPGNILVGDNDELTAIVDWGSAGYGDPAQDLSPAWSVLDASSREIFRDATGVDEATWIRARTFELEHAVGGVLYYRPRDHPLGTVMSRTLERILSE